MGKRLMEKSDYKRCDAKKSVDSSSSFLPRMRRSLSLLHYPRRRCQPCTSPFPPSFFLSPFPQKLLETPLRAAVGVVCSLCKWGRLVIGKCWWGAVCEEGGDCRAPCNASGVVALAVTERELQISGSVGRYVPLLSPTGQWECGNHYIEIGFCSCSALADLLLSRFARQRSLCCRLAEGSGFSPCICFEGWEVCKVLARAVSLGGTRLMWKWLSVTVTRMHS